MTWFFRKKIQNASNTNLVASLPKPEVSFPDFSFFSYRNLEFSVTYENEQLFFSKSRDYSNFGYNPPVAICLSKPTHEKVQNVLRHILPLVIQNSCSEEVTSFQTSREYFACKLTSGEEYAYHELTFSGELRLLGSVFMSINKRVFYYDTEAYYILCTLYDNDYCGERTVAALNMHNGAAATALLSSAYAHAPHGGGRERWLAVRPHSYEDIRQFAKHAYQEKPAKERAPERFAELNEQTWKTYLVF